MRGPVSILLAVIVACAGCVASAGRQARDVAVADHAVTEDRYPLLETSFPDGVVGRPDVIFARAPGYRPLTLDLYLPRSTGAAPRRYPLVLFIHGGTWERGDARHAGAVDDFPAWLAHLAARGFVVASVNYRLSGEARFPASLMDAKIALRWLRQNASTYSIDPARPFVWGVSAGGQLAGLMALGCGAAELDPARTGALSAAGAETLAAQSDCVQGAVIWYAPTDFGEFHDAGAAETSPEERYLGCRLEACPRELISQASPIAYASADDPPLLLIHGRADDVVAFAHSASLHTRLSAAGGRSELVAIDGVNHSFIGQSPYETEAATRLALDRTTGFLSSSARSP